MKNTLLLFVALISMSIISAQPIVKQQPVSLTSTNLRLPNTLVLQTLIFPQHTAGTVVLRFDGTCFADSGDRIVVAASNLPDWAVSDGNVGIEVANATAKSRSFSHTRVYNVLPGIDTFYAVAQNTVDISGSGIASIYGHLTAEFFPATGPAVLSHNLLYFGNLSAGMVPFDSLIAPAAPMGKAYLHADGQVSSDAGDRIMISVNYQPEWTVDDGSIALMAAGSAQRFSPFMHTRAFDITGNPNAFYAVAENVVDQGGSGNANIYGNICTEFFPSSGAATLNSKGIVFYVQPLRGAAVALDSISISVPAAGAALVEFDGYVSSDVGDQIVLAGSDSRQWTANEGSSTVSSASYIGRYNVFSHSRLYPVTPGTHTFYCLAENHGMTAGSGNADILGNFSVKYYPAINTGINDAPQLSTFAIYPNPAGNRVVIALAAAPAEPQLIQITDLAGRVLISTHTTTTQTAINISDLPAGLYMLRCGVSTQRLVKE